MTDLSDLEIVLGKLVAGLLNVLTILAASVGLLMICTLFGGISFGQVTNLFLGDGGVGGGRRRAGLVDRTLARPDVPVDLADDPDGRRSRWRASRRSPSPSRRSSSWACRWWRCSTPTAPCWRSSIPAPTRSAGVVRTSSVVYIACRLTFAAALVAFGTWKLRKWNPGQNEPRELREEDEIEAVETLVEIEEEAEVAGGGRRRRRGGSLARARRGRARESPIPEDRGRSVTATDPRGTGGTPGDEPGPTTGLHVPRRTHRRIAAGAAAVSPPLGQPDPLARADDPRLRHQAADRQGVLHPALRAGHGPVLPAGAGDGEPAGLRPRA